MTASEAVISTNELDLLTVVYCIENFLIYVYDKKFKLVSDHKAIASVLKSKENIRKLTDYVSRLDIPFDIDVIIELGKTLKLAEYLFVIHHISGAIELNQSCFVGTISLEQKLNQKSFVLKKLFQSTNQENERAQR